MQFFLSSAKLLALLACVTAAGAELPVVFEDDFEKGADAWAPTDAQAWKLRNADRGRVWSLFQQSAYEPPHRSPVNIALLKDVQVTDFQLDVKLRSTVQDYDHRDLCLVFGYQDKAHFYYVHLGKKTDDHANQVFIVNAAPRTKISLTTNDGTNWDDEWHNVRIVREVESGKIEVYFDDMARTVMTAQDRTFTFGQVGIGSFDDTGEFDDFRLRGTLRE